MRRIDYIIYHCSATRADCDYPVEALHRDHLSRGFKGIGYHFYITRNGQVHATRPLGMDGAHCQGHNRHSIGICYEGGLNSEGQPADTRTAAQREAMHRLTAQLLRRFHNVRLCGHRDLSPDRNSNGEVEPHEWLKQCPCFDVAKEL